MPAPAPVAPRQMLPPPTTMATSVSSSRRASASSMAMRSTISPSMVSSLAELANASPETFRTTRFHGCVGGALIYLYARRSIQPAGILPFGSNRRGPPASPRSRSDYHLGEADDLGVAQHLLD